jgi:hypothetical protein
MIGGILKSQFATVFWNHALFVTLAQHQSLESRAAQMPRIRRNSKQPVRRYL